MARVIVADDRDPVAEAIIRGLVHCPAVELCRRGPPAEGGLNEFTAIIAADGIDTIVYSPPSGSDRCSIPDLEHAKLCSDTLCFSRSRG
jgi:hypothetical protein